MDRQVISRRKSRAEDEDGEKEYRGVQVMGSGGMGRKGGAG